MHTAPPRTISSEHTVAKTGLRMKKLTIIHVASLQTAGASSAKELCSAPEAGGSAYRGLAAYVQVENL
jgi:hypothetical protein